MDQIVKMTRADLLGIFGEREPLSSAALFRAGQFPLYLYRNMTDPGAHIRHQRAVPRGEANAIRLPLVLIPPAIRRSAMLEIHPGEPTHRGTRVPEVSAPNWR
jgi:hypothetical protein